MPNSKVSIRLGDSTFDVKPMNFQQMIKSTQILSVYLGKSGNVVQRIMSDGGVSGLLSGTDSSYGRMAGIIAEFSRIVGEEAFEADIIQLLSWVSGIQVEELYNVDMLDLIDQLPAIVKASRFDEIVRKLSAQFQKFAPPAPAQPLVPIRLANTDD